MLQILDDIFNKAKQKDEFEYACALLRIKGMEDAGWDPLAETRNIFADLTNLFHGPLLPYTRLRLALLLYCHLIEVKAIYEILENMLRTIEGNKVSVNPFLHLYGGPKKAILINKTPPSAKQVINCVMKHAQKIGETKLLKLLDWMFCDAIRNAFFHSDYIIYKDELRSREAWFLEKDKGPAPHYSQAIKIKEVEEIINNGLLFFQVFMRVYTKHRHSYKKNKKIKGRMGQNGEIIPVELLANNKGGIYGFRG